MANVITSILFVLIGLALDGSALQHASFQTHKGRCSTSNCWMFPQIGLDLRKHAVGLALGRPWYEIWLGT